MDHKLSMNALIFALVMGALVCFGAFILYGAWIDGRREKLREEGLHPTMDRTGVVHAREAETSETHASEKGDHDGH